MPPIKKVIPSETMLFSSKNGILTVKQLSCFQGPASASGSLLPADRGTPNQTTVDVAPVYTFPRIIMAIINP
jgi:hypothetical protein